MPKMLITGTLYLITVDAGECGSTPTPFRLYGTRSRADKFMRRLELHYQRKPQNLGLEADWITQHEWWVDFGLWLERHPGGKEFGDTALGDWKIRPMPVC